MIEVSGNIWDLYNKDKEAFICVTTNGFVKNNGECVMGAGIAKEAKEKFNKLPSELGNLIKAKGNNVYMFQNYRIFTFPTKDVWYNKANIDLIIQSSKQLIEYKQFFKIVRIYLPKPGCGNGKLRWYDVKHYIKDILDDQILIVDK